MITRLFRNRFLGVLFAMFTFWNIALAGDPAAGKTLFINNCASCHAKDMKTKSTGPALGGVEERWAAFPKTDLYSWIRNSTALIAKGHPRATELWNTYKPTVMNSFTTLKDDEIENILAYIKFQESGGGGEKKDTATNATTSDSEDSGDNTLFYGAILAVLAILALVLSQLTTRLNAASYAKDGIDKKAMTLGEILKSKSVVTFAIFGLIVLGGYTTVNNAIAFGRQQGYAPDQPIKFSHATHAGEQKIDCQYCHDAARRSKHASIPATNTCMNCHAAIKVGSKYGTAELTKIYASIGYDPSTGKYIPNYENMSEDQVAAIYKKWIGENYTSSRTLTSLDKGGELLVANQWEGIKSSLTNELKGKIQGSIEWTRVHSLPDHVYFNHSQHVSIGKVACQTCHGKVENMEVMAQHSPLSMGWCINCHRQTDVKFKDNAYYDSYKRYHDELKSGKRESVKVEEIGGLECQKCHY